MLQRLLQNVLILILILCIIPEYKVIHFILVTMAFGLIVLFFRLDCKAMSKLFKREIN